MLKAALTQSGPGPEAGIYLSILASRLDECPINVLNAGDVRVNTMKKQDLAMRKIF